MGKGRNKKGLSDKVRGKKSTGEKKVNPFEVKVNRQKHDILGRKVKKDEQGMPGRSRSRAFQKVSVSVVSLSYILIEYLLDI